MRPWWLFARAVSAGWLLMAVVLTALVSLVLLLDLLQDVGDGRFTAVRAWLTVAGGLPAQLLAVLPFVALLGTLYALANMGRHNELIPWQAAGVSPARLAAWAMAPALGVAAVVLPMDEHLAAPLQRAVLEARQLAKADGTNVLPGSGIWSRHQVAAGRERMVNVAGLVQGQPTGVAVYAFSPDGELEAWLRADAAQPAAGQWQLQAVQQTTLSDHRWLQQHLPQLVVPPLWGASVPLVPLPPAALRPSDLLAWAETLAAAGEPVAAVQAAWWQRVLRPVSVLVMALLAVPLALGHWRGGGMALRLGLGAGLAVVYQVGAQVLGHGAVLAGAPGWLGALLPAALVMTLAVWLLRRG